MVNSTGSESHVYGLCLVNLDLFCQLLFSGDL